MSSQPSQVLAIQSTMVTKMTKGPMATTDHWEMRSRPSGSVGFKTWPKTSPEIGPSR